MTDARSLHARFEEAARRFPDRIAIEEAGSEAISYRDLERLSGRLRDRLVGMGVGPGDRVGLCLPKTIDTVAAILGILRAGAAYVPTDPGAPPARDGLILADCTVRAVVTDRTIDEGLVRAMEVNDHRAERLVLESTGGGSGLAALLDARDREAPAPAVPSRMPGGDDLAYILYTSGSTGRPKGVMLTHENGTSFVDWAIESFAPKPDDRFSSHAPFHFDLSILDLYVPLSAGATLVLIGEDLAKDPIGLADLVARKKLTVWYSTPSVLSLMTQYGRLGKHDLSRLRTVLFAGEVFPVRHLRALKEILPAPRYFNLYGPTETNVCTWYEIPATIPADRTTPFPIGATCSHCKSRVVDESGAEVPRGEAGELIITGAPVTGGYWNLPERNAAAYFRDADGTAWYRTGDVVQGEADGIYTFLGRRDRMVKRRGYRVELGEIEAGLYRHPDIREAAVVAVEDEEGGVRIRGFIALREGVVLTLIALRRFCAENLPAYMIPDAFTMTESLPKTSTDKIDYQRLKEEGRWISR